MLLKSSQGQRKEGGRRREDFKTIRRKGGMEGESEDGFDGELEDLNLDGLIVGVPEGDIHSVVDVIGIIKGLVEIIDEAVVIVGGVRGWSLAVGRDLLTDLIEERALRG